jgi:hypothetical protein
MGRKILFRRVLWLIALSVFLFVPLSNLAMPRNATAVPFGNETSSDADFGAVRFVSMLGDGTVSVSVDGRTRATAMVHAKPSAYLVFDKGSHTVSITTTNSSLAGLATAFSYTVTVTPKSVATIVLAADPQRVFGVSVDDTVVSTTKSLRLVNVADRATLARVNGKEVRLLPKGTGTPISVGDVASVEPDLSLQEKPTVAPAVLARGKKKKTAAAPAELKVETVSVYVTEDRLLTVLLFPDRKTERVTSLPLGTFAFAAAAEVQRTAPAKASTPADPGVLVRNVMVGLVLLLVSAVIITTLASKRQRAMEERVRGRLRGVEANPDELAI